MKHISKLFYFLIIICSFSYSQEKYNSLLWEISGNGLSSHSYLYGTMHTSDEKFFNLSDSVFAAIESVESFANEINMDSMEFAAIKLMESGRKSRQDVSKILSKADLELLNKKLKETLGISLESLPVKNPAFISIMLEKDLYKGNMPYFIDEYLYKVAKAKGKKILGIESIDDQINLINSISDEDAEKMLLNVIHDTEKQKDSIFAGNLFDAYLDEDLDKISELTSSAIEEGSEMESKFLLIRNLNMAEKISQYVKERSIFAAIGAAHLPGVKGVLELLKEKGYHLRPVKTTHTGLASVNKSEMFKPEWVLFSPPSGGFTIEMPGKPTEIPMPANIPGVKVESGFYSEAGINYFVVKHIYPDEISPLDKDSVLVSFIKNLNRANYSVDDDVKNIKSGNFEGKEFKAKVSGLNSLSKIFLRDNSLYWIQVLAPEDKINSPSANRFFNSLKFILDNK